MAIARIFFAIIPAVAITFGLLLLMHFLINANLEAPEQGKEFKIPEIVMPDRVVENNIDLKKPEKPDEVEEPPPEIPEPEFEDSSVDNSISINPNVGGAGFEVGGLGGFGGDGDFLPIVKVAAKYPSRALSGRGIEGYCTVIYTVTASGETRDVREHDCPQRVFLRSSIKAASKFKYKPRIIDDVAVEVPGVQNRFVFELPKE